MELARGLALGWPDGVAFSPFTVDEGQRGCLWDVGQVESQVLLEQVDR